jgi:N-acetylglucosaminyldiphosphoundecaprenol N-acetyl-beta-D-mannosaminyltransferase
MQKSQELKTPPLVSHNLTAVKSGEKHRKILGVDFFTGTAQEAVDRMIERGGLLVVPSGPGLKDLPNYPKYREALAGADMAIMDSALMVMLWNKLEKDHLQRLSGLEYLALLLEQPQIQAKGKTMWVMASAESAGRNVEWLNSRGIEVPEECVYVAPMYGPEISDPALIERIRTVLPDNIILSVGGGTQEPLGYYLKRSLDYSPGIHCIGAAIAFLSGDQVKIPMWADRLSLGWFFRCLSKPKSYIPRYWEARKLIPLIVRHRNQTPA